MQRRPGTQGRFSSTQSLRPMLAVLCIIVCVLSSMSAILFWSTHHEQAHAAIDDINSPASVGINLLNISDSSTDFPFADVMKSYRLLAAPGQSNPPTVDASGSPQGDFQALLWDGSFLRQHTTGTYSLRFQGQATVSATGGTLSNVSYDAGSNTSTGTWNVSQDGNTPIFTFTNTRRTNGSATNTGITNLQLMRPSSPGSNTSYSFSTTFTDPFKTLVSKFSTIRFMNFTSTNANGQVNWSDRRLPQENQAGPAHNANEYGWEGLGGAWEYVIQLCNETNRDCYINVPAQATGSGTGDTNSYVYKLAQLFKYGSDSNGNVYSSSQSNPVHAPLNSNLHLYIEYSNELWNTGGGIAFTQAGFNHDAAKAEVQAGGSPLNYDGASSEWDWSWRRVAKRIVEISNIFRNVFGDSAMISRVRPVLEWQIGNGQGTAYQATTFLNNYYNNGDGNHVANPHPPTYYVWGGGGATYSSVNNQAASSIDEMYNSGLNTGSFTESVKTDANFARAYGLHYVSYEGGFNIGGDNPGALQSQANIDPRARDADKTFQTIFDQAGGDLLMYFNSSGSGPYSRAFPDVFALNTPKLQAIDDITHNTQAQPTNGTTVPATIDGNNWTLNSRGWGNPGSGPLSMFGTIASSYGTPAISWATYNVRANSAGNYNVTVNYSSTVNGGLNIYLGSTLLGNVAITNTGGNNQSTASFTATLPAGVSTIRLVAAPGSDDYTINSIQVGNGSGSGGGNTTPPGTTPTPTPTPDPGTGGSGNWTNCASEGSNCSFSGTQVVRYGANGQYLYKTANGSIACGNSAFGSDPAPGVYKSCATAPVPPSGWTNCGGEGGTCNVPGTATVAFGANGQFVYKTASGNISCGQGTFGSDPIFGVYKSCYYLS